MKTNKKPQTKPAKTKRASKKVAPVKEPVLNVTLEDATDGTIERFDGVPSYIIVFRKSGEKKLRLRIAGLRSDLKAYAKLLPDIVLDLRDALTQPVAL